MFTFAPFVSETRGFGPVQAWIDAVKSCVVVAFVLNTLQWLIEATLAAVCVIRLSLPA